MTPLVDTLIGVAAFGVGWGVARWLAARDDDDLLPERTSSDAKGKRETKRDPLGQIVRSLPIGILLLDGTGHVIALNAAAETILGLGRIPAQGRAIIELVSSTHLERRVREALEGTSSSGRIELLLPGETRDLQVITLPRESSAGGAVVIVSDETHLHDLERARRDFVANLSHELRTPLSSIKLMIETVADAPDDVEARELFLPRIREEVDRLVEMVEELLDLARVESGRMEFRREGVDLAALSASVLATFEPRAQAAQIALRRSGNAAFILGDSDRLKQVLVNLIDNALRHTEAGGTVAVDAIEEDGVVRLLVGDTGAGIPFNDLPHVFERFYVVDRSRTRAHGGSGTGLGLSIVKHIVELHGGTVGVESDLGQGSVFSCTFPALKRV